MKQALDHNHISTSRPSYSEELNKFAKKLARREARTGSASACTVLETLMEAIWGRPRGVSESC